MNWSTLVGKLVEVASGRAPTEGELHEAALAAAENEEERELLADYADPWEALREEMDPPTTTVLSFLWKDGFGSAVEVGLIEAGDAGLLIQVDDSFPEENRILACVAFPRQPGVLARQLVRVRSSLVNVSQPSQIVNHLPHLIPAKVVRGLLGREGKHERVRRGGFTTLGVPLFFCLLSATAGLVGLPVALLVSPVLLRLALAVVPPPSRHRSCPCPGCRRVEARWEARRARRQALRAGIVEPPRPAPIFDPDRGGVRWKGRYLMPDPDRPGVYVLAIPPAVPASQPRLAASRRPEASGNEMAVGLTVAAHVLTRGCRDYRGVGARLCPTPTEHAGAFG